MQDAGYSLAATGTLKRPRESVSYASDDALDSQVNWSAPSGHPALAHPRASRTCTPCTSYHTSGSHPVPTHQPHPAKTALMQRPPPIQISSTSQLVDPIPPGMLIARRSSSPLPASVYAARRMEIAARSISTGTVRAPLHTAGTGSIREGISQQLLNSALQGLARSYPETVATRPPDWSAAAGATKAAAPPRRMHEECKEVSCSGHDDVWQERAERRHLGTRRESDVSVNVDFLQLQEVCYANLQIFCLFTCPSTWC
jgi:hypothetical protein